MEENIKNGEVTFIYTGIVSKNHEKKVFVRFERDNNGMKEFAEGELPSCLITRAQGFTDSEKEQLSAYLKSNCDMIFEKAGSINLLKSLS